MANPWAGEVSILIDGQLHICKLTLGALAELEADLEEGTLLDLIARFENKRFSGRDVLALLVAGLRGGGWNGTRKDLISADIEGGAIGAAKAAATLLAYAFSPPA